MVRLVRALSVGAACAAAVFLFAATPKPKVAPTPPPVPMATRVGYFLKYAPTNFAQIRGRLSETNSYDYARYKLLPVVTPICHTCDLDDTYADSQYKEAWAVAWYWYYDKKKAAADLASDGISKLAPLLKGFKMTRGVDGGRMWVNWDGPNNTWVFFKTNGEYEDPNIRIRVGHSLAKAVNIVKPTKVSEAEKQRLQPRSRASSSLLQMMGRTTTRPCAAPRAAPQRLRRASSKRTIVPQPSHL